MADGPQDGKNGHVGAADADADEVTRLREEILRLRDALIGKEAELGTALGRVAELEAYIQRYESVSARLDDVLHSRSWRVGRMATLPVRWLKGRAE